MWFNWTIRLCFESEAVFSEGYSGFLICRWGFDVGSWEFVFGVLGVGNRFKVFLPSDFRSVNAAWLDSSFSSSFCFLLSLHVCVSMVPNVVVFLCCVCVVVLCCVVLCGVLCVVSQYGL